MNARHAARELALLTLFQLDKGEAKPESQATPAVYNVNELILSSVRALSNQAQDQIKDAAESLAEVSRYILENEMEHPTNLNAPIDAEVQPVPLPTTRELVEKIEQCLQGAEYLFEALRIPELAALAEDSDVQQYANRLILLVFQHKQNLDALINQFSSEWRVERLMKMDRLILRLAAVEMKYVDEVDFGVSINEAVELSKQFSSEESFRLVNGILGAMAEALKKEGAPHV